MSSVIIAGNTSGTITLDAPNVAGTTTLTLPTTSGTIALTASPTFTGQATIPTINLTGGQITFPATQSPSANANTLDDYEEGTWTPTFYTAIDGGGSNLGTGFGSYVKIGKIVTVSFYRSPGGANALSITGMPFTPEGDRFSGITSDGLALYNNSAIINYRSSGEPQYSRAMVTFIIN